MIEKVKRTITAYDMLPKASVLVALSGGADSVALLHIMHGLSREYGFLVYAAHVNHNLRGDAAVNDEKFSVALCDKMGIRCFVKSADVKRIAKDLGVSEEMAGRKVRYEFFDGLMREFNIDYTATAHHKNDNAETVVMNFIRGSGIGGLSGIPPKRARYIRPLIDITRGEIERYCSENKLQYVTDMTNLDTVYTRNKIRNVIIPEIEREFNSNFVDTVSKNSHIIRDDEDYLETVAKEQYEKLVCDNSVSVAGILSLHKAISRRIIRHMIDKTCGITDVSSAVTERIYEIAKKGSTGLTVPVIKNVYARIEYGMLIIEEKQEQICDFSYTVKVGDSVYIRELDCTVTVENACPCAKGEKFRLPDGISEITITNRREGDRFVPKGMSGTKSLKSFMIDNKIPRSKRDRIGIVRIGGEIAWVLGYRRDERFTGNDIVISVRENQYKEVDR